MDIWAYVDAVRLAYYVLPFHIPRVGLRYDSSSAQRWPPKNTLVLHRANGNVLMHICYSINKHVIYTTKIILVCPPIISETIAVGIMNLAHRPRIASTTTKLISKPMLLSILYIFFKKKSANRRWPEAQIVARHLFVYGDSADSVGFRFVDKLALPSCISI